MGPPLVASVGVLPVQLTRFFGREAEIAQLREDIAETRVLTLLGAPGCGKTRLAIEVAGTLAPSHPGGAWFVDLASIADPALVAEAVAAVLGVYEQPGQSMLASLSVALSGPEPLLLVLDNCEHVVVGAADVIEHLVSTCPSLTMLATSRVALGLTGEHVWNVPALDQVTAVELFVDRASLALSQLDIDDASRVTVDRICAQLDGLPLAIELSAAWIRVLSLEQIADRLGAALPQLPSRIRTTVPRHQTIAATVDWSVQLLSADAQEFFDRLSVFAGGFDLEAAEALAMPGCDVLTLLTALVDQSLVSVFAAADGTRRYSLLEPVRQCGEARLAARGEAEACRRDHAEYFAVLARRFDPLWRRGIPPPIPLRQLEREEGNLLAALDWARFNETDLALRLCIAMLPFWEFGGRVNEGRAWLGWALDADTTDPRLRAGVLGSAARLAWRHGEYADAHLLYEQGLTMMRYLTDLQGSARIQLGRASTSIAEGDVVATAEFAEDAIALAHRTDDAAILVAGQTALGWARYLQGDVAGGDEVIGVALAASRALGHTTLTAQAYFALQFGALLAGDTEARRAHLAATMEAMRAGGFVEESDWLGSCISLAGAEGRVHSALRLVGGGAALSRRRGSQYPDTPLDAMLEVYEADVETMRPALARRLLAEGERMSWDELVAEALSESADRRSDPLTPREWEVAELVGEGVANVDIARKLGISRRTVDSHVERIRKKLGLASRDDLVTWMTGDPSEPLDPHERRDP